MITNFENITKDLTTEEKRLIPVLIGGFKLKTKSNPVKAPDIISRLRESGYKITQPRLRKLCNLIRSESIIPLIATSKGYFVSYDKEEIRKQVLSLQERSDAILNSAKGLEQFLI